MFERNTSGTGLLQQHQSTNGNASYCSSNNGYTDMSVQNNGFSMSDYYSGGSHHHVGSGVAINGQSQHNAAMSYHHSLNTDSSLNGGYHYGHQSECCYDSYDLNPLNSHANGGNGHPMHYASTQQNNGYDFCTAQDAYVGSNGALLYSAQCDALPQRGLLKPMHSTAANNNNNGAAANGNNSCIGGPDMYALMNGHYGGGAAAGGYHSSPTSSTSYASTGSDESDDLYGFPFKRSPSAVCEFDPKAKRPKQSKKRKPKRDPNEPQKPVSAYALFFRDTQAAIKGQNPNATFGEVSKIVASMWDSLDTDAKNIYKQKTETAKKDYLKQLAAYRASLVSKGSNPVIESFAEFSQAQRKLLSGNGASAQSTPDSTTATATLGSGSTLTNGSNNGGEPMHHRSAGGSAADLLHEIGGNKSLASLIAEPSPQHVLTATTTLTVPPSYIPARMKTEFDEDAAAAALCLRAGCGRPSIEDPTWDNSYCSTDCVVTHCRDLFTTWIPTAQAGNGTYAPV